VLKGGGRDLGMVKDSWEPAGSYVLEQCHRRIRVGMGRAEPLVCRVVSLVVLGVERHDFLEAGQLNANWFHWRRQYQSCRRSRLRS
jgi:hypothetical protein